jgi:hypothetical protein
MSVAAMQAITFEARPSPWTCEVTVIPTHPRVAELERLGTRSPSYPPISTPPPRASSP